MTIQEMNDEIARLRAELDNLREQVLQVKADGANEERSLHWMRESAEIAKLRKELAAERERNRWIPVEKGLPKDEGFYEVSRFVGNVNLRITDIALYHNVLKIWVGKDSVERNGVTHYKPLPEPPEQQP